MNADALKRLEQLEALGRWVDLQAILATLEAETGIGSDEILAEAERIARATGGLSREQVTHWLAQDLVSASTLTEGDALEIVRTWEWPTGA